VETLTVWLGCVGCGKTVEKGKGEHFINFTVLFDVCFTDSSAAKKVFHVGCFFCI